MVRCLDRGLQVLYTARCFFVADGAGHVEEVAKGVEDAAGDDYAVLDEEVGFRRVEAEVRGLYY